MKTSHMRAPGKKPQHMKRPNFSKGGMIKKIAGRHYFDDGGSTTLTGPSGQGASAATVNNNGLTGTIGNALGLNNQFQGQAAPIQQGTNAAQLNNAYTGAQSGLTQQQQLAGEVAGGGQQGVNTQNALTGQLEGVVNGTGPNAAQTALNQNTAANVATTTAEMAGQRGANANPGLIARESAQQGAATQQAAAGQAATLQAQQAIAAQGQLANLASTQVGQQAGAVQGVNQTQQNEQNVLQGANTAGNNANVSMEGNLNNVNSQTAAANQNESGNIVSGITNGISSIGSAFGLAKGGEVTDHHCAGAKCTDRAHYAHMMADGGPLSVSPSTPAQGIGPWLNSSTDTSGPNIAQSGPLPTNSSGPIYSKPKAPAAPQKATPAAQTPIAGNSAAEMNALPDNAIAGNSMASMNALPDVAAAAPVAAPLARGGNVMQGPHGHVAAYLAGGGAVPAMVSAKEVYLSPEKVRSVIQEGANPLKIGETFKGKAKKAGNSLQNDTIPKTLEEGGVVVPRSITTMKGPGKREKAELFVHKAVHMRAPKGGAK